MQTFRDIGEEAYYFRETQLTKYTHIYSIALQVAMPSSGTSTSLIVEPILQVMEDADFHITHVTGSCGSPVDSTGKRVVSGSDMVIKFGMAGSPNRSDRGISFKIINTKKNLPLTEAQGTKNFVNLATMVLSPVDHTFIEFGTVFTPGYGYDFGRPMPFEYTLQRGERFKIPIQCVDFKSSTPLFHRVSMAFIGNRYDT